MADSRSRPQPSISLLAFALLIALCGSLLAARAPSFRPGSRVTNDAHNCYPYHGEFADRVERALSTGTPVAIEQDLVWFQDPQTGSWRSIVAHGKPYTGAEPGMKEYFFERIRPLMERALRERRTGTWPLVTLNLDFKTDEPEHHRAVLALLRQYEPWLTTATRAAGPNRVTPLHPGPLLVLTGYADSQQEDFHDAIPVGGKLLLFGAVHVNDADPAAPPATLVPSAATNYRRWWNNPWKVVEPAGQRAAGPWTPASEARLRALVDHAHSLGLWIRFYTLNGHPRQLERRNGWDKGYNFGSREAVTARWQAAIRAGVDYIASDQYEDLGALIAASR